ncbi:type II secretion system protein [Bacillus tianshenii]|nr:type II secretion system protein [Bacillus tianshenii]
MGERIIKNQKGLTLIELLAVIVILGVIAAIAVPSVGKIIENAKKDAHIANATRIVEATRLYLINENPNFSLYNSSYDYVDIKLLQLKEKGYMPEIKSPTNQNPYHLKETKIRIEKHATGEVKYSVRLIPSRDNGNHGDMYFNDYVENLNRDNIQLKE